MAHALYNMQALQNNTRQSTAPTSMGMRLFSTCAKIHLRNSRDGSNDMPNQRAFSVRLARGSLQKISPLMTWLKDKKKQVHTCIHAYIIFLASTEGILAEPQRLRVISILLSRFCTCNVSCGLRVEVIGILAISDFGWWISFAVPTCFWQLRPVVDQECVNHKL